ncbi:MAG: FlgD immunoglobulin-like domain containing protein [Chitinivibrionales bacterium]
MTTSDRPNVGCALTDVAWPDVSIAETAVFASKNIKNAVQNWDSLKMVFSNGQYKPASTSFLFPRSANPLDIKIFDMRGKIVREFHVSFISGGSSIIQWNRLDIMGRMAPAGNYTIKMLANNFEQAIIIAVGN